MNSYAVSSEKDLYKNKKVGMSNGLHDICAHLAKSNFIFLTQPAMDSLLDIAAADWKDFQESWNRLEQDTYMKDGGTYRFRRHATYSVEPYGTPRLEPAQPHYQSLDYNPLNGGIARHFAPVEQAILDNSAFQSILGLCAAVFTNMGPFYVWHIEVHQFRILAQQQGASPTPEGIHRDGVDFVFMMLIDRVNVLEGCTRVVDLQRRPLGQFTLTHPMEVAIVNDHHVMHGVTPILPENECLPGYRDVLVITFRKKSF